MEDYASEGRTKAIKRRLGTAEPPKPKKVEPPPLPIRIENSDGPVSVSGVVWKKGEPNSEDRSISRAWGDGYIERVEKREKLERERCLRVTFQYEEQ